LFEERLKVFELDAGVDYRLDRLKTMEVFLTPADAEADRKLEADFRSLSTGFTPSPVTLQVHGRKIEIPMAAEGVAMASFGDLCEKPLGAADYLAIAECFHTVLLRGIPRLGPEKRNEAKRFVTLIDALYEAKVNLICSAEAPAEALYIEGDGAFEFQRTVSRLMEMRSADYMALPHAG
ncbi:MAG: cell division protein ZapE, partial [Rhodospirillales bacterium]|nr:cell division protein ZapE [Rhodospirillales bacterium]